MASGAKPCCLLICACVIYGAPTRHPVISVLCNSHSVHSPDPPNCFRAVRELSSDSRPFYTYVHGQIFVSEFSSRAPTPAGTRGAFSSHRRLCRELCRTRAQNKVESEQEKAKQSKISNVKPLQSFLLWCQGVAAAILPRGSSQRCQQFCTK